MRRGLITIVIVLAILQAGAVGALTGPSHTATDGTRYVTNSGLEVKLGDTYEIEAVPFADDQTFTNDNLSISAAGSARTRIANKPFTGDTMQATQIDARTNPITFRRADYSSDVTVSGGTSAIIMRDVQVDDGQTDLTVVAASATNVTITNVPSGGIQAVDATGTPVAGETDTSDGTVTLSLDGGSYDLRLQDGPAQLEVRDLVNKTLVQNGSSITVEVQFFGSDGAVERRTTTDGKIDMTGLPADERFSVSVDAGGQYVQRQILIPSLLDQQTAYLLPQDVSIDTVEPRFIIEDPSNQFDTERSEIVLERPINEGNGTQFVAVAGDRVGLNGFDTILERDQRYRVTVRDPQSGAQRELGEFTPTQSEQVKLTVQDVEFDSVSQVEGLEWGAEYVTNEQTADEIRFVFRDSFETQTINYEIHKRGDPSTVLRQDTAAGNVTITQPVPPGSENTVWVVNWTATRGTGETLSASRPVSTSRLPVGPGLAPEWQTGIAMIGLFVVAGLFGAANPGVGGIAVAGTGGMFWLLGWLPDSTGGLMVVLALFVAVLAYVGRKARGATA